MLFNFSPSILENTLGPTTAAMVQIWNMVHGLKPIILMVIVQAAFVGINVLYKLAINHGINLRILIAYRYLFAAAFTCPLAFFMERKSRQKLTWTVFGQAFLSALFGGSLFQNLYLESLALTSATFAAAITNLVPGVTFILAVSLRLEKYALKTMSGRAKVLGTLVGIVGAMILTFYKGIQIKLSTNLHLLKPNKGGHQGHVIHEEHAHLLGALLSVIGCLCHAAWLIVQAKMSEKYPSHYSSTALMSLIAAVQTVFFALCVERDWEQWKLGWDIRLLTVAYTGIIGSGLVVILIGWCVHMKGPLFVSIFNPLQLILVALAGSLVLDEKLYIGSMLGAILIVLGLYGVLLGKGKEIKMMNKLMPMISHKDSEVLEIRTVSATEERKDNKDILKENDSISCDVPKSKEDGVSQDDATV